MENVVKLFPFQSLSGRLREKSRLPKKVLPELQPARVLKTERDVALQRAEQAKALAKKAVRPTRRSGPSETKSFPYKGVFMVRSFFPDLRLVLG